MCFKHSHGDDYFIPELLPHEQPALETAPYGGGTLRFDYRYIFMPKGIISRFISRLSYLVNQRNFWKNGVELCFEDSTALVLGQPLFNRVRVAVTGPGRDKLMGIVQSNLEHIHDTLNMKLNTHYQQMIPCGCSECKTAENPHFFDIKALKRRLEKGKTHVACDISVDDVLIQPMLTGYTPPPQKNLLETLLESSAKLAGRSKSIKENEDSRTGFICQMLEEAGFDANEQARWGQSGTGKQAGEVDLLVTLPKTGRKAACEAFNLSSISKSTIDDHLRRVFLYDPLGSEENFILVYAESKDFSALWKRYLDYLPGKDNLYPRQSGPTEIKTPWAEIKHAKTIHRREDRQTTLHHIFINMNPKRV